QTTIPVDIHTKPIKHRNKVVGAVEIFRDASIYDRVEKQKDKLRMMSFMDFITSLPNRRYAEKKIKVELSRFKRCGYALHVALIDIDRFKNINDTYGHGAGDIALRKMASLLEDNLRATDFIGRYGGEEFLLILPDTTRRNAGFILEKFRKLVEMHKYQKGKMAITISIGATKALKKDTPETILRRADKALYKAKNSGRNRVCFAG
ncbi:MAG: GGDEF domain-containing protein, partial [Candidatus Omnitrophota bacterium]